MAAFFIGLLGAALTLLLWFGLMTGIGFITDSGAFGICGSYGSFGGILFLMFFATPIISMVGGIVAVRIYQRRKKLKSVTTTANQAEGKSEK
jgi:hypothetical protein